MQAPPAPCRLDLLGLPQSHTDAAASRVKGADQASYGAHVLSSPPPLPQHNAMIPLLWAGTRNGTPSSDASLPRSGTPNPDDSIA